MRCFVFSVHPRPAGSGKTKRVLASFYIPLRSKPRQARNKTKLLLSSPGEPGILLPSILKQGQGKNRILHEGVLTQEKYYRSGELAKKFKRPQRRHWRHALQLFMRR